VRGQEDSQSHLFTYISAEERVPADHPLRPIKAYADAALKDLSFTFDVMYSKTGRPSIPPERLLKAQLLIALHSVRSDRQFCEMLDYNMLFRWFLDMNLDEPGFDASTFSKNRDRLLGQDVATKFFDAVVRLANQKGLLSQEHFTVDGTLIEAWASHKSFQPKDGSKKEPPDDDPGNPTVNFRGETRSNKTHQSTTDPEARLMRKGGGESRLSFSGHVLMENRNGLCVDMAVLQATGTAEREAARLMITRQAQRRRRPKTLGADKGYHSNDFVSYLRGRGIAPHIARREKRNTPGLDGRTSRHEGYEISQRKRKLVEQIFGWMKTIGGLRKTRFRGVDRTGMYARIAGAAYNLVRMTRLLAIAPAP
jgi:transposase